MSIFAPIFEHFSPKFLWIDFTLDATVTPQEGRLYWDDEAGTLELGLKGGDVNLAIGQEILTPRAKAIGSDTLNGQAVYVSGASGANPHMSLAMADAVSTCCTTIAIATEDVNQNSLGYYVAAGLARDLDTSAFTAGEELFLSATVPGGITNIEPVSPYYSVSVGICMRSHATEGIIFVNIRLLMTKFSRVYGLTAGLIPFADVNGFLTESANLSWIEATKTLEIGDGANANIDTEKATPCDLTIKTGLGKTLFYETAPVDDLNFDPDSSGGNPTTLPDYVIINNVIHREFTSSNNQICGSGEEIPHKAKLDSLFYPHCHIFLKSGESAGTTGVTFTLYWELRQSTGTTSGSAPLVATSAELGTTAGGNKFDIYNGSFAGPSELGAQLKVTIARTGGNAGDVVLTTYGIHYHIDTPGSRTLTSK